MKDQNKNTVIIQFQAGGRPAHAVVGLGDSKTGGLGVTRIKFPNPIKELSGKEFDALQQEIVSAVKAAEASKVAASALPVQKMNLGQALAHVFKGGDGRSIIDRLGDIQKMAEGEMTEKEKHAANSVMKGLKDLSGK